MVGGAQRPAAGVGGRAEARCAVRHHHADVAAQLALHADAVSGHLGAAVVQEGGEHLDQLALVDGAAPQLEVDGHVRGDRGAVGERGDELGLGVDDREVLLDVGEVAQRLDAAGRRAGADGHQVPGDRPHLPDALDVVRRRHRALDEGQVEGPRPSRPARLEEVGDLDGAGHRQQLVLAVEQGELAAVARGELPDRQGGAARCRPRQRPRTASSGAATS